MSLTTSESLSPLGEPLAASRRKRLSYLARMVFELMIERYQGGTNHKFDGVEDSALIDALRVCSSYTDQIGCSDYGDWFVVDLEGVDGHKYIIQFSVFGLGFTVWASRVRVTSLPLVGREGQLDSTHNTLDILEEFSQRLKLGRVTADRAFLIGMSLVIGFMDPQEDDDPGEEARLASLSAQIMPTDDELREIRTKLPQSGINYDEEGDQPY